MKKKLEIEMQWDGRYGGFKFDSECECLRCKKIRQFLGSKPCKVTVIFEKKK